MATMTRPRPAVLLPGAAPTPAHSADHGRLLIQCRDRPGIVSAVSSFLIGAGANIVTLAQHTTAKSGGVFFQRAEFHLPGLAAARDGLERDFAAEVAGKPFRRAVLPRPRHPRQPATGRAAAAGTAARQHRPRRARVLHAGHQPLVPQQRGMPADRHRQGVF
jgi:ACT domain-containing protein